MLNLKILVIKFIQNKIDLKNYVSNINNTKMLDYAQGKIYKLVNNVDDEIYVGSTVNLLRYRKKQHKYKSLTWPDRNVYKHLNEIGWDNVEIILIEYWECKDKCELESRERYWIELLKPSLNKCIPTRTHKEYYEQNRSNILEKCKEYVNNNKELVVQRQKKWTLEKVMCECGSEITRGCLSKHKKRDIHINKMNSK